MAPVLKPNSAKVDGMAFLGLSLARKSDRGHPESVTHQIAFDLNDVLDRSYEYLQSTNDDGFLVGGGEPGAPKSYKLPAKDSAHVEIMHIGTYNPEWGGISEKEIIEVMKSGKILIPQIEVLPTSVVANECKPPELQLRFDMPYGPDFVDMTTELPPNWQLRFIHNQLFKHFYNPSRFCPSPFHTTLVRKAEFRSSEHKDAYFSMCDAVLKKWKLAGPRPLNANPVDNKSGIWLFTDRTKPTHFFPPNFLPPYNTEEKRQIILSYLTEEWDEKTLSWKKAQYPEKQIEKPKTKTNEVAKAEKNAFMEWCGNPIEALLGGRSAEAPPTSG
mmetsp:Transcript_1562/g.3400  ORF Transcript_1562/g.3400 Transcript_1562/m.3400 type:complete len:329 (+) Transcript_1562:115-1101(+)|eukprot:CAMPEP_0172537708 /NCGR_PEP_ID=MMETSP1067-20121228/9254_1 /TAXON_ID=265564 ORGANISM="Thalassiosira punctigera, Strain Tpunct2005C2" /NCGR_SAMPLE_ID=MMETSP1067 /ASSEMBLY_ACC=CAM_ASM_000444 /LENGTH=328 /DNA_ID=CAMNT_0013323065 /DNA_START=69 /DNA_END=1055 /DNA_ORIENTATION=-